MGFIKLEKVSKNYFGFSKPLNRILAGLSFGFFGIDKQFKAIRDINLSLTGGQVVGIIGRNGAGKSTLLKLIAGVIGRDEGSVVIEGKVRALLELSVGFNSELSGEENVFFNGLVWGYKPKELKTLTPSIFEFADLLEFKNSPLKNYSSGMAMRLGFSLATATRPDILIVDEALAVGDASFQQKCLKRIRKFKEEGSLILVVSHDLSLISHFSDRVLLLEKGELLFDGEPKKAIERYMLLLGGDGSQFEKNLSPGNFKSEFLNEISIGLENEKSIETKYLFLLDQVTLKIRFTPKVRLDDLTIGFHIDDEKGVRVFGTNSFLLGEKSLAVHSGKEHQIKFLFPVLFREGKYSLGVSFHKGESHIEGSYFWGESLLDFEVERGSVTKFVGLCHLPTKLEFT